MTTERLALQNRVLLITASAMHDVDGGQVMFRSILDAIGSANVAWIACGGDRRDAPPWMQRFVHRIFPSIAFNRYVRATLIRSLLRRPYLEHAMIRFPRSVLERALEFAREQRVTKVWVHASGAAVFLGQAIARELGVPVHTSFQDDAYGNHPLIGEVLEPYFANLVRATTTADVASDAMRELYERTYGVSLRALTLLLGSAGAGLPDAPAIRPLARRVAYAGNVWCPDAMFAFCDALALLAKRGERFSMTMFTPMDRWSLARRYPFVEFVGLVPSDKLPARLGELDLLYCPMAFTERKRRTSEFSMPGKTFTYLQAQVPSVFHGPPYASNIRFSRAEKVGLAIESNEPHAIADALVAYSNDLTRREADAQRARDLVTGRYAPRTVLARFFDLLDA